MWWKARCAGSALIGSAVGAAPGPVFGGGAEARVDGIHNSVVAAAVEVVVIANEVIVGFLLPKRRAIVR